MYHKQGKQSDHGRIFSLQSEINLEGATEPNPLVAVFSHYVCFYLPRFFFHVSTCRFAENIIK